MTIRVLRLLEYTYSSAKIMERDMARWGVQGAHRGPNDTVVIKSTVLPFEVSANHKEGEVPTTIPLLPTTELEASVGTPAKKGVDG